MSNAGAATYRLSTSRYCPTCGGKAQDPQMAAPWLDEDGEPLAGQAEPEPCDEPYHDADDADYRED
jgi:hypothetical protein